QGGNWIANSSFSNIGIINGSLTSQAQDFESYQIEYNYGNGWRFDSTTYQPSDRLHWNIKYVPDSVVEFKIHGYDSVGNSEALDFSFINDQNYFSDLYIENYAFDKIYDIFESVYFKIIPVAQDMESLTMNVGSTVYSFMKVDSPSTILYFEKLIEFDPLSFDFEGQYIDTIILTITASDLNSQNIQLEIPFTASLGLDADFVINSLEIEKDFYYIDDDAIETTWWKFDNGAGVIIYDSSGNNDGTLTGTENWVNGRVGDYALDLEGIDYIEVSPIFNEDQDPFSFAGWIKLNSLSNEVALYGEFHNSGYARNYFSILQTGALSFDQYLPLGGGAVSGPGLIEVGTWVYFAVVKEDNYVTFYKNGVKFDSSVPHFENYTALAPTIAGIGARYYNSNWDHNTLNGTIDDFRFFDKALKSEAIKVLYNNSFGVNTTLLEASYDGFYFPNDKIFDISNRFWLNATSSYSNEFDIPYYNSRPTLRFSGLNYGNVYEYDFEPYPSLYEKEGVYGGTYDFESDENGSDPAGWTVAE
ncbi:hypothetical protein LCGC14_2415290, partial [marine sediment metagenome]